MPERVPFTHLHVHSEYSLLDGACRVDKLVEKAIEYGMDAVALTDHGRQTGLLKLQKAADKAGIKAILGIEAYMAEDRTVRERDTTHHITLLAETDEGLRNLYRMNYQAFRSGMYNARPRIDYELLKQYGEGVIVLTGCMQSLVMQKLINAEKEDDQRKREHAARDEILKLIDCVGKENVYVEVQNSGVEEFGSSQWEWNAQLKKLADDLGLICVGTADTHYLTANVMDPRDPNKDTYYHEVLLCVQANKAKYTMQIPPEQRFSLVKSWDKPHYYHLRTIEEMRKDLANVPGCIENTQLVAERCNARIQTGRTFEMLPRFPVPDDYQPPAGKPEGMDLEVWKQQSYLRDRVWEGLHRRYGDPLPAEVVERAEYELGVINRMGTTSYFLIIWDLVRYAKSIGVAVGPGRGSGAGSLVLYSLNVTQLDPLKHNLLFERFLSPERISMPDVDIDFGSHHEELRAYLTEKYGEDNCAQIITFQTIGGKAGIRRAATALYGPEALGLADRMAKAIPMEGQVPVPLQDALRTPEEIAKLPAEEQEKARKRMGYELQQIVKSDPRAKEIVEAALWMEGLISAESVHAAGFVVAPFPLTEALPIQLTKDGHNVTSFSMAEAEEVGCLKLDLLGLRNLTIITETQRLIEKMGKPLVDPETGEAIDPSNYQVPLDNKKTYEMLARGDSVGVFQFESQGMQDTLRTIGTTEFNDLIAIVSAYRPGAMDQIPVYARRKKGLEPVTYGDPRMKDILDETYGLCLTGDTRLIDAETGEIVRLDELVRSRRRMRIQGVDEHGRPAISEVTHHMDNGVREVFEVTLQNGARIRMTPNHPLLTEEGWKPLSELHVGDQVACPRQLLRQQPRCPRRITRARLKALAAWVAQGCSTHPEPLIADLVPDEPGQLSAGAFLPQIVFTLPDEELAFFLAAFLAQGGSSLGGLASRRLANDLQTLLLMLGIQADLSRDEHGHYSLVVSDATRFFALLHPHLARLDTPAADVVMQACLVIELDPEDLETQATDDPAWSSIASIAPAGRERVYDITVKDIHSFVANNIIVHNCLYQEQSMLLSRELAGFTGGLMDTLRKAIGKKKMDQMMELKPIFFDGTVIEKNGERIEVPGAIKNGVPRETAEWVWSVFEASANYSFNKSHAAAYALISYVTAYLKANFPTEYMAALLTSVMNTKDKVPFYLYETRKMGIEVLPPDINHSQSDFEPVEEGKIRFGLTAIKGVGGPQVEEIVRERETSGPYKNIWDFCQRVEGAKRDMLEALIHAGAFDSTGHPRKGLITVVDDALRRAKDIRKKKAQGQDSLFDLLGGSAEEELSALELMDAPAVPQEEYPTMERFALEREATGGVYVSGHPLDDARAAWERIRHVGLGQISDEHISPSWQECKEDPSKKQKPLTVAGIITAKQVFYTRRDNRRMLKITLEDLTGNQDIMVFPKVLEKNPDLERILEEGQLIWARIIVEEDKRGFSSEEGPQGTGEGAPEDEGAIQPPIAKPLSIHLEFARPFDPKAVEVPDYYDITVRRDQISPELLGQMREVLAKYPGQTPARLVVSQPNKPPTHWVFPEKVEMSEGLRRDLEALVRRT